MLAFTCFDVVLRPPQTTSLQPLAISYFVGFDYRRCKQPRRRISWGETAASHGGQISGPLERDRPASTPLSLIDCDRFRLPDPHSTLSPRCFRRFDVDIPPRTVETTSEPYARHVLTHRRIPSRLDCFHRVPNLIDNCCQQIRGDVLCNVSPSLQ